MALFGPDRAIPEGRPPRRLGRDLTVIASHEHAVSGARLIRAANHIDGGYVVGWVAPWQRTLRAYHSTAQSLTAMAWYARLRRDPPPVTDTLCRDFQVGAVYRWEEDTLDAATAPLNEAQMKTVVKRLCADFNRAAAPTLAYKKPRKDTSPRSYYDCEDDHIKMGHNTLSATIHELAHKIDREINGNDLAPHGPSFVRTMLVLAARYQYWHDPAALEDKARKAGLLIAPATIPICRVLN